MFRWIIALLLLACAAPASALRVQLDIGSIEHPALPAPLKDVHLDCRIEHSAERASCKKGELRARIQEQKLALHFDASVQRNGAWNAHGKASTRGLT